MTLFDVISAALLLGLFSSGHCALMCGPLACAAAAPDEPVALGKRLGNRRPQRRAAVAWHLGRIAGYAVVGGLLGVFGRGLSSLLGRSVTPTLPWVMAAALVASVAVPRHLWAHLPALPGIAHLLRLWRRLTASLARPARAALLGALTPLLPCGLLFGLFAAAIAAGGPLRGALTTAAFAVGATPALAVAQLGQRWLVKLPPWTQRLVPLVAAGVLVWRAVATTSHTHCH